MTRQEFILNTLLPYFLDPATCAYNEDLGQCVYLTSDDKKCAFGQHLKEYEERYEGMSASDILRKNPDCLTTEALEQKLTGDQWNRIQAVHDRHARFKLDNVHWKYKQGDIQDVIKICEIKCGVDLTELKTLNNELLTAST